MIIQRDYYLNKLKKRINNRFIKVITGIRRSGKSFLLNELFYSYLLEIGVNSSHIIKFAFDSLIDLTNIGISIDEIKMNQNKIEPSKFINYINSLIKDNDKYYLLLDEVQNLDSFELVLNGYLAKKNLDIYVTGSNSKFLSSEVITEFLGRGDEIRIHPLSFKEYYNSINKNIDKYEAYNDYLVYGGLPALINMNEEEKISYLKHQMNNVYLRDIKLKHKIINDSDINDLLNVLASNISTLTNPKKLENTFKSLKNSKFSASTIDKYISYFEDSFILEKVFRYDIKGKKYIQTPYKIYFEDLGLRNARLNFRQIDPTHLIENLIYNELRIRDFIVDVGIVEIRENKDDKRLKKQLEIDFIASKNNKKYYIQSAYRFFDEDKLNQETRPLNNVDDSFKKIIITDDNIKSYRDDKGYLILGILEFLLNDDSLDI